ncbi:MAG: hydrogenase iron-sulfur subunit [Desulfobaccales bacterium]
MTEEYTPKIIGFCCRWCSYAGADLAGAMRLQYPPTIRIIMVPCTGRVDILHLLKAFEVGADAVFLSGCHEGDCHYLRGNIQAKKRVARVKDVLAQIGLEPERLEMFHVSSGEGPKFAGLAHEMTERALRLGPNPVRGEARARWLAAQAQAEKPCGSPACASA